MPNDDHSNPPAERPTLQVSVVGGPRLDVPASRYDAAAEPGRSFNERLAACLAGLIAAGQKAGFAIDASFEYGGRVAGADTGWKEGRCRGTRIRYAPRECADIDAMGARLHADVEELVARIDQARARIEDGFQDDVTVVIDTTGAEVVEFVFEEGTVSKRGSQQIVTVSGTAAV